MEINNTAKIGTMLSFEKDDFYFVQVLKRRKDNPEMEKDMVVIDNFYIPDIDEPFDAEKGLKFIFKDEPFNTSKDLTVNINIDPAKNQYVFAKIVTTTAGGINVSFTYYCNGFIVSTAQSIALAYGGTTVNVLKGSTTASQKGTTLRLTTTKTLANGTFSVWLLESF